MTNDAASQLWHFQSTALYRRDFVHPGTLKNAAFLSSRFQIVAVMLALSLVSFIQISLTI